MFKSSLNKVLIITDGYDNFPFQIYESLIKFKMDEQFIPMLKYPEYEIIKVDEIESKEYYPEGLSAEELEVLHQLYEKNDSSYSFIFDISYNIGYNFKSKKAIKEYINTIHSKLIPEGFYVSIKSNPAIDELKVKVFGDYISKTKSNIVFFKKERTVRDIVREYSPIRSTSLLPSQQVGDLTIQRVQSLDRKRSPAKCIIS